MGLSCHLSPAVKNLVEQAEDLLGTEISLLRRNDAPPAGLLIDSFSFPTEKNIIVLPTTRIGLLRDLLVGIHCVSLLLKGSAERKGEFRVLSHDEESAFRGVRQIYLDILKDERTRTMGIHRKRKISFYLFMLFFETLSELPWKILSHLYISRTFPILRTAQVYDMMKESMMDMHELVAIKDLLPARYFSLHNGMYYARDTLFAEMTSEYKLNPVINIPELKRFKNLDVKELIIRRWSESSWYRTKIAGDVLYSTLSPLACVELHPDRGLEVFYELYRSGVQLTEGWISSMQLQDWYFWDTPSHQRKVSIDQEDLEKRIDTRLFGEE